MRGGGLREWMRNSGNVMIGGMSFEEAGCDAGVGVIVVCNETSFASDKSD